MDIEKTYDYADDLPYNPSDVDIRQQSMQVDHLVNMIKNREIDLWNNDDYQRSSGLWGLEKKSRFIESLIMRIPIPIFYLDGSQNSWKIIDGLQRLTTLYQFINENSFKLTKLEYLKTLEGSTFNQLPFNYQRSIKNAIIQAYIINPGTPEKVKLNIFQRINTGGEGLRSQEIRNAYFRGKPLDFIKQLSKSNDFIKASNNKISTLRMRDDEFVLRFFAFYKFFDNYKPPMDRFLDYSMEQINNIDDYELDFIKDKFNTSMIACKELFDNKAFISYAPDNEKRNYTPNIAVFEIWAVNLAKLEQAEIGNLIKNKFNLLQNYYELFKQHDFYKSISSGTSSKNAVHVRFNSISELIKKTLYAY